MPRSQNSKVQPQEKSPECLRDTLSKVLKQVGIIVTVPRIAFAANRQIGIDALRLLVDYGMPPVLLMVPCVSDTSDPAARMERLIPTVPVLRGKLFRSGIGLQAIAQARPDYILSVHFPFLVPRQVLDLPRVGTLNLHPAYLPYNRGWHTPSWAIADETPYGATLHWMDEGIDSGDIALQQRIDISPSDTAHRLYQRVLAAELQLLERALPRMATESLPRRPQTGAATEHRRSDLQSIQQLDLSDTMSVQQLLRRLRALTTNSWDEAAYFEEDGVRYRVRVEFDQEKVPASTQSLEAA